MTFGTEHDAVRAVVMDYLEGMVPSRATRPRCMRWSPPASTSTARCARFAAAATIWSARNSRAPRRWCRRRP